MYYSKNKKPFEKTGRWETGDRLTAYRLPDPPSQKAC